MSVPATNTKSRRSMCSLLRTAYNSQGDHGSGRFDSDTMMP
jgi:hypothetical protein